MSIDLTPGGVAAAAQKAENISLEALKGVESALSGLVPSEAAAAQPQSAAQPQLSEKVAGPAAAEGQQPQLTVLAAQAVGRVCEQAAFDIENSTAPLVNLAQDIDAEAKAAAAQLRTIGDGLQARIAKFATLATSVSNTMRDTAAAVTGSTTQ